MQDGEIVEFEQYAAESDLVLVLLTPDDVGRFRDDPGSEPRARQNVIFELGFLIGRLKRNLICALYEEGLELPSDYQGAVCVEGDDMEIVFQTMDQ